MLSEQTYCQQRSGEPRRRWFTDDVFDLIVWFNADESIYGFQLCYDKEKNERALTWIWNLGYTHKRVDTGEMYGRSSDSFTPILISDGYFNSDDVANRFLARSQEIDPELVAFVVERVAAFHLHDLNGTTQRST